MKEKNYFKIFRDYLGFLGINFIILFTKILPVSITSFIFGNFAVLVCSFIPTTYLVLRNLKFAMPEKSLLERYKIMFGVWYNLGRFVGEYFYIYNMEMGKIFKYVHISDESKENIEEIKNLSGGSLIFSAHYSNWEAGLRALNESGIKLNVVFRRLNSDLVEPRYSCELREKLGIKMIAKQDNAGLKIIKALKRGETVLILADQRDSGGDLINFFGKKAYTNKTIHALASKMKIPVYAARVVRNGNTVKFNIDMKKFEYDGFSEEEFLQGINNVLESWIREYPEQWFWVHNRWRGNKEFDEM